MKQDAVKVGVPEISGPFNRCVRYGDLIFIRPTALRRGRRLDAPGSTCQETTGPAVPDTPFERQGRIVIDDMEMRVEAAGSNMGRLVGRSPTWTACLRFMLWAKDQQQALDRIQGRCFPATEALPAALIHMPPREWIESERLAKCPTPVKRPCRKAPGLARGPRDELNRRRSIASQGVAVWAQDSLKAPRTAPQSAAWAASCADRSSADGSCPWRPGPCHRLYRRRKSGSAPPPKCPQSNPRSQSTIGLDRLAWPGPGILQGAWDRGNQDRDNLS
jgi:hypothetical protein